MYKNKFRVEFELFFQFRSFSRVQEKILQQTYFFFLSPRFFASSVRVSFLTFEIRDLKLVLLFYEQYCTICDLFRRFECTGETIRFCLQ